MAVEELKSKNEWEEHLENVKNMTLEQKRERLASMLEEGQRLADRLLGWHGEPTMTRDEVREMMARKYPGLSLSDQIIEDRESRF
jgi:hypothetical protein